MNRSEQEIQRTRDRIEALLARYPLLAEKINRAFLLALHRKGAVSIDDIYQRARRRAKRDAPETAPAESPGENVPQAKRWDELEKRFIREITLEEAARHMTAEEVEDLVYLVHRREEAQTLEEIANLSTVSFRLLADRIRDYCRLPVGPTKVPQRESLAVRVALIRQLISSQLEFIGVAKRYLRIRDFADLVERIIGDDRGIGSIGGKAAGMLLAHRIIEAAQREDPRAPKMPVAVPDSFFLRSDVIERFLDINGLVELQAHKYKSLDEVRDEYPLILEMFKNSEFPKPETDQLREVLRRVGSHPLIVRSSSLLEDRFGTSFAGKYRSVFVANQGTPEENLAELIGAIVEVYASILHPDPISYRQRHNLLDFDENMAVLIQKVVGRRCGRYFLPVWAGVAFCRNEYRWTPRIRREDGLARIVFGLGTRAVDRVSSDYPRMMPLGMPTLRPEAGDEEIVRYSQRLVDVIDLEENRFDTRPVREVLGCPEVRALPGLDQVFSVMREGHLQRPAGTRLHAPPEQLVVTFDKFAASPYPGFLRWMLGTIEKAYGCPVDVEFAYDGRMFHILQCRPQAWREEDIRITIPENVPAERRIFSSSRNITNGSVHNIRYIVLIDPKDYDRIGTMERRHRIVRVVNRLNERLAGERFILMGPGRWGTNDPRLGVPVGYADINNTRMLIEIARLRGGHLPEVSFGTHFFQDLVEADIRYLALYPDDEGELFNESFLHGSPNRLAEILPDYADFAGVVRVIDVSRESPGLLLHVDMDGEHQQALGYLGPPA
ncbi:MAG: pyruvate, phosphate dikinase [Acidobacteria bacterium]|nr:MAG: pyruvate, phosphate dikinase [Acidobacteriota bacterium]